MIGYCQCIQYIFCKKMYIENIRSYPKTKNFEVAFYMSKPRKNDEGRKRLFAFQINYEFYNQGCEEKGETPKPVDEWLADYIKKFEEFYSDDKLVAYEAILHDKDVKYDKAGNATPKGPHIHATIQYSRKGGAHSINAVMKAFDITSEGNITNFPKGNVPEVEQMISMMAYHQHKTNKSIVDGKHTYKLDEVYYKGEFKDGVTPENAPELAAKNLQKSAIDTDVLTRKDAVKVARELRGVVNAKSMKFEEVVEWAKERFGDDVMDENSKSFAFLDLMKVEINAMLDSAIDLAPRVEMLALNVFVQGNSGSGKSLLMKHLGKRVFGGNVHYMSSASKKSDGSSATTPDPYFDYHNEQMSISDEADSFEMSPQPTMSLLDRVGTVAGRGKDHPISDLKLLAFNSAQGYYHFIQNQLAKVKAFAISNSSSRSVAMEKKLEMVKADGTELELLNRSEQTKSMLYQLERRFDYLITVGHKGWIKIQKRLVTENTTTWSEPRFLKWVVQVGCKSEILPTENIETIDRLTELFVGKVAFENLGSDDMANDFKYECETPERKSESILGEFYLKFVRPNIENGSVISKEILYPMYKMIEEYEGTSSKYLITPYTFEDYLFQLLKKDGWKISDSKQEKFADYNQLNFNVGNLKTSMGILPAVFEDPSSINYKMTWGTNLPHWMKLEK